MLSKKFWKIVYITYPHILRVLEKLHFHHYRQKYHVGFVKKKDIHKIKKYLLKQGYEPAILAWKDPGEMISMRKIDKEVFSYHLRIFKDWEVRAHYEYASEAKPLYHITEKVFMPKERYYKKLLRRFL